MVASCGRLNSTAAKESQEIKEQILKESLKRQLDLQNESRVVFFAVAQLVGKG